MNLHGHMWFNGELRAVIVSLRTKTGIIFKTIQGPSSLCFVKIRPVVSNFVEVTVCMICTEFVPTLDYRLQIIVFSFLLNLTVLPICPGLISPTVQHMDKHRELQI